MNTEHPSANRRDLLNTDSIVKHVRSLLRLKAITRRNAETALRNAGCYEAEIREVLS